MMKVIAMLALVALVAMAALMFWNLFQAFRAQSLILKHLPIIRYRIRLAQIAQQRDYDDMTKQLRQRQVVVAINRLYQEADRLSIPTSDIRFSLNEHQEDKGYTWSNDRRGLVLKTRVGNVLFPRRLAA